MDLHLADKKGRTLPVMVVSASSTCSARFRGVLIFVYLRARVCRCVCVCVCVCVCALARALMWSSPLRVGESGEDDS